MAKHIAVKHCKILKICLAILNFIHESVKNAT